MKLPPAHIPAQAMEQGTVRTHRRQPSALVPSKSKTFSGEFLGHFAQRLKEVKGTHCQANNKGAGFGRLVGLSHETHSSRPDPHV
jgi:hypothetical protein